MATRAMREVEWQAKEKARKELKEKARLEAKEAKAREAVARRQREEEESVRRGQEADVALRKAVEAASFSGAHEPLKAEIQRRKVSPTLPPLAPTQTPSSLTRGPCCSQDDAGVEALADARAACDALAEVARQAKAERSRADAMQRRETEALLAFEALVSVYPDSVQSLKSAIAAAQPHAKAMPDLFGRELAAARDQLLALEVAEAADRRELQGLPPPRAAAPARAASVAAPPESGRAATRRRAETDERDAMRRSEQASRDEARQQSTTFTFVLATPHHPYNDSHDPNSGPGHGPDYDSGPRLAPNQARQQARRQRELEASRVAEQQLQREQLQEAQLQREAYRVA